MAIRYVKDFEFPSAAGYTKSATKVTGQMYAKGGDVKAPKGKGMMIMIGVGLPKKGPMKKAEGGSANAPGSNIPMDPDYMKRLGKSPGQGTPKKAAPKKPAPSTVPGSDIPTDDDYMKRLEDSQKYAKGGKAKMEKKVGKVMHEFKAGELHSGSKKGPMVKNPKQAIAIALSEGKKAMKKAHGGMAHEDVAEDKALIKKMVKPAALTGKAKGGYADGGMTPLRMVAPPKRGILKPMQPPSMKTPSAGVRPPMPPRPGAVPVAPRNPMIDAGMSPDTRVGVGQMRPGSKPNVGAIRAAMARAATRANPDMAPAAMKKGGKTKMDKC